MGAVADQIYDVACLDVGFRGAQPPPVVVRPAATAQQMQKPRRDRIWE
jgi:regulator of protease activity HflC (stomatin/prohibitin superfamily)